MNDYNLIQKIILHLSLIDNVGPKTIQLITKNYIILEDIYRYKISDFVSLGLSIKKAEKIWSELKDKSKLYNTISLLKYNNICFVTPYDVNYPAELLLQDVFPPILYQMTGSKNSFLINDYICLGIVSSRKTNPYGYRVIYELLKNISGYNIAIISGGAIGGDTIIHEAAIKYGLKTISVIGSGLLHWYPTQNELLFKNIIASGGALMSHFNINQVANKTTFPIRNSVIAGMSRAVLVIQAGEKSGTLITAQYALEYNKNVGAIPGYIDDIIMKESNNLIKQGAACILDANDILDLLKINSIKNNHQVLEKNEYLISDGLILIEKDILAFCVEARSINEIKDMFNIEMKILYEILFNLVEKNYIKQNILGDWVKI